MKESTLDNWILGILAVAIALILAVAIPYTRVLGSEIFAEPGTCCKLQRYN